MEGTLRPILDGGRSGICRCCLSMGPVESMLQIVGINGATFADMLKTCYALDMIEIDQSQNIDAKHVICERCIASLNMAHAFRKQVESATETLREQLRPVEVKNEVKLEIDIEEDVLCSNYDEEFAVAFPIKTIIESPENNPSEHTTNTISKTHADENLKTKRKVTKIGGNLSDEPNKEASINNKKEKVTLRAPRGTRKRKIDINMKELIDKHEKLKLRKLKLEKTSRDCEDLDSFRRDCRDYYFFKYFQSKYKCAICNESYTEVDDFKTHARQHDRESKEKLFRYKSIWSLKLDISSMSCGHCDERVTEIGDFRNHLSLAHNIESKDIFNRIMPYNLDKYEMKCIFCKKEFLNFVNLNVHMNEHCDSNMCSQCDRFFPNLGRLKEHMKYNHSNLLFKCKHCELSFESGTKRYYHTTVEHGTKRWNKCQYCSEKFKTHYQKILHLSKAHNKELKRYQCKSCPEKFVNSGVLSMHVRAVHLQERNNVCSVCGKSFFRRSGLTKHMVKHTGERNYRCEVCNKSYARPYTLKEHMKIHNNEKNHVCQFCGRAFVAKCSLKYHLKVHKNETLSS